MLKRWLGFSVFIIFLFVACSRKIPQAQLVANDFFKFIMLQQYNNLIDLIDDSTLMEAPADQWIETIKKIQAKRGGITKFYPEKIEIYKDINANEIVVFDYKIFYDNNRSYKDKLYIIFRKGVDSPKVIKYEYNLSQ